MNRRVDYIVVHSSKTQATEDIGRKEIERKHRAQGWWSIGYHFVIRRDGTLEQGRPTEKKGAHCQGRDRHSIGICLVGGAGVHNRTLNNFTPEQFDTLSELVSSLTADHPCADVRGHKDMPGQPRKTTCPAFDVLSWYQSKVDT